MNIRNVIIAIILIVLALALGVTAGIFYEKQKVVLPQLQTTTQTTPSSIQVLSSKVVPSITAYGLVTKITGTSLTLASQGDSAVIPIKTDAKIYSFTNNPGTTAKPGNTTNKQISFSDIKIGDSLSVNLRVLPTGDVEGFTVFVLPVPSALAPAAK